MAAKVIIVTGASRGIGLAVTDYLLRQSHQVVLVSRTTDQLQVLKEKYPSQVEYLAADMTASDTAVRVVDVTIKAFGRVDGVVINHGVLSPIARLEDASLDEWKKLFDVNLFSALALVKETIPHLRASRGSAVFVSSGAALKGYTAWGAYGGSKAALNSLAQHLAVEEPKIAAIAISPGRVDSDMQKELREKGAGVMSETDYAGFKTAFDEGTLNKPEWPAAVIARLALGTKPELSGKYFSWNAPELSLYQDAK